MHLPRTVRAVACAIVCTMLAILAPQSALASTSMLSMVNAERAKVGAPSLTRTADLDAIAQRWSGAMAAANTLSHNPNLRTQITNWRAYAENVAYAGSEAAAHTALMNSPGHRTNILNRDYTEVGIGLVTSGGRVWVTQVFRRPIVPTVAPRPAPAALCPVPASASSAPASSDRPAVVRQGTFFLRLSQTRTVCFPFGKAGDVPLMGDWDGNGTRTPGVFRAGSWYLRNSNSLGGADVSFAFGSAGDVPLVGDWNRDGVDSVGVFRSGRWYLRDRNSTGAATHVLAYGSKGDVAVVGDWDGNGTDTPGVVRGGTWLIANSLTSGRSDRVVGFGSVGDLPVAGDWDGDGVDTVGVFRSGRWLLTNSPAGGSQQAAVAFGSAGDRAPVWR